MTVTSDNITAHELTGLNVKVAVSSDPGLRGLVGVVRDETRNTILVEVQSRFVIVPKMNSSFIFQLPMGQWVTVEGSRLRFRPEDRVKRGMAKW